jgi:hypothetical protein
VSCDAVEKDIYVYENYVSTILDIECMEMLKKEKSS